MPLDSHAACTVCIPTFNQVRYLRAAVESVAAQTAPVHLIVADDASLDDTPQVLAELQRQHRFQATYHPANLGISANLQDLLRCAETPYIVRLDSDDVLGPRFVEVLLALLARHPAAGYAHCAIRDIDEHGRETGQRRLGRMAEYQDADTALRRSVLGYQVAANILMFRRDALSSVHFGAGSAELNFVEDYELSIRLADAGWGNVYSGEVLASYRTWAATSRPVVGRKLREVQGLAFIYAGSLLPAFERRGWGRQRLRRRRAALALANAEVLDRATFTDPERRAMVEALLDLGGMPALRPAFGRGRLPALLRRCLLWSGTARQEAKRWVKQLIFRNRGRSVST